jgi:hypothetical protein
MTPKYKILLITDSLGFPRAEPELVTYEESYVALLKGMFDCCDFIHHGRGGATILDLYKHSEYYHRTLNPHLVFMQSGVVDCAPRALTVIEQQVVTRLPLLGKPLTALVKRHSSTLRRIRKMTYTTLPDYRRHVEAFERLFAKVYWVEILPASRRYDEKLRGIAANIERYNAVLRERRHVPTGHFGDEDTLSDMYHLSTTGNRKMAQAIAERLALELHVARPESRPLHAPPLQLHV